jgi:hypothetical protein
MAAMALVRFAQLLVAASVAVACSSAPSYKRDLTIVPGERTTVRLAQVNGALALSLQNHSAERPDQVYRADSAEIDPGLKIVADVNLQSLLDVFSEKGMFAQYLPEVPAGSRDVLTVEQGQRRWVWAISADRRRRIAQQQQGTDQAERTFHEARAEFLTLYNSSDAFHGSSGTGRDAPDFGAEQRRLEADRARRNLQKPKGSR